MEGGRAPKPKSKPTPPGAIPRSRDDGSTVRESLASVELEDIEEVSDADDVEITSDARVGAATADARAGAASDARASVPPPLDDDDGIDVELDEGETGSVDKLLAMTGESWSIDAQRNDLKEAAKDPSSSELKDPASGRPSLSIPTPYDLGAEHLETDIPGRAPRTAPPPLPGAGAPSAPPPLPSGPPPPRVSGAPPPLPSRSSAPDKDEVRKPPVPSARPPAPSRGEVTGVSKVHSAPPAPPAPPPRGDATGASKSHPVPPPPPSTSALGSRRPPPPVPREGGTTGGQKAPVAPPGPPTPTPEGAALVDLLTTRIERLEASDDRVGLARAYVEQSIVQETLGDDTRVNIAAESALKVDPEMGAAHSILRRRVHGRGQLTPMLRHLEAELAVASSEAAAVELLAERARLLFASERLDDAREAWELALGRSPHHAAALKGLEADLVRRAFTDDADDDAWEDLVAHLGRTSDAFAAEPSLAAWLHVERARILEFRLGRVDAARGAYERALRLDGGVGPVRDAVTLHVAAHHDSSRLATLLAEEARFEVDPTRCARLELDAACLAHARLGDDARAVDLLERAAARAPTSPSVDRRVLDELVRLYEAASQYPESARARRARLVFFTDASALVYELRQLASLEERLDNVEVAIGDVERALALDPADTTVTEELDRLLTLAGKDDDRVALWHGEAQRAEDGTKRARALGRAAQLAEQLGRHDEALRHLRAAWVAAPGDSEILDHLSRLMSPPPPEAFDREVRALIELYAQAAQSTRDAGRRVAYLEKVAMLWEELVGDPTRAARVFEEILRIEPGRRGAILGLERTAGRIGDDRALSRALADEATLAEDGVDVLALRVRSAQVLARVDPPRALAVIREVLEHDPAHAAARALETRLYEDAGQWEQAATSLRARIELASTAREKVALWLSLAHVEDARLKNPKEAVEALQQARRTDPVHPVPPEEIARVLEAAGDVRALRAAVEQLATDAITPQERARHLTHAAEIDELRLDDHASAASLYARALAETPDDEMIGGRLARVLARRVVTTASAPGPEYLATAAWGELLAHLGKRAEKSSVPAEAQAVTFLLSSLLVTADRELGRASGMLESLLVASPRHVGGLRMLEQVVRRGTSVVPLSRVLKMQSDSFTDARARLGTLWELASLEAWRLTTGESVATYTRVLEIDPTDPSGLEAAVRLSLGAARRGDASARRAAIAALRSLSALAQDASTRIAVDLRLALLLETHSLESSDREAVQASAREALERLRACLALDPMSVAVATSLARLANRLGDAAGAAAAAISLADLAVAPRVRAKYLVEAANIFLGDAGDETMGTFEERTEHAAHLLEKALDADPNSTVAATRLSQVRTGQGLGERLVDVFRSALASATSKDAIVLLGSEIARVARDDLGDVGVAIEAMRKVRAAAPDHVPSLLTLSELFIAQRAWPEAVESLEDVVGRGKESGPRITALFALASVYEKILARPLESERALRKAVSIEPENPRAIRALVHRLAAKQSEPDDEGELPPKGPIRQEIASLLERLAGVEPDRTVKGDILLELADIRAGLKDATLAEKALVEAVATAPDHPRAFARLARFFRSQQAPDGVDYVSYARALAAVIGRGGQLGTQDARWFAQLGHVEVAKLNRLRDGAMHLSHAVQMDPTLHESRFELATAYSRLGAHDDAAKTVMSMISPTAQPLVAVSDPAGALELLERALGAERRQEEGIVVSELRAIAGELDEGRHNWLRSRRLAAFEPHHTPLDRATLVGHVVPPEGRSVLLDVAHAIAGVETKLLRADVGEIGLSPRDRIGKRSGHPTRALLDRLSKALGLEGVELVVTPNVTRTRVLAHDQLWVVVPKALTELPEPTQLASIGRALARIAFSVPWLEELPPPHIEAMLCAAARCVQPTFGKDDIDVLSLKLVLQYEPNLAKELSRKQKQNLERILPLLTGPQARLVPVDQLIASLARAELRAAYLLTGDVLATIDELRGLDAAFLQATEQTGRHSLGAVLDHPFAGDVVRYALTPEATALRRRVGSTWAG